MKRVVQWATGTVGRHAAAAVHRHPELDLVGAYVYSTDKAGRDVGDICGIGPIGVSATSDPEEIVELDADCVLYMAQGEGNPAGALDDICRLLESGKNVISTAVTAFIYPRSAGDEVVDRLQAACDQGGTSFHGTGIEPGWAAEVLPLTMSGLFSRIDSLVVQELLDYSTYDSAPMLFDIMGFGKRPDEPVPMGDAAALRPTFGAPLMLLADGLGAEIDDFEFHREVVVTDRDIDVKAGRVQAGTVAAQRFGFSAIIGGRRALTVEHITRLGDDQAPDWPTGRGWKVTVEGSPSMVLESRIATHGEDETDQGCLGTAMHAVHAIVPVCAAEPGIRTFLDLPTIVGRHVLG
ncbi:diacylglycerol kinase [soil metagenome]